MTKIFYMKNFLLGLVKVQSTQLPPVFFAQIHGQKEFQWEKIRQVFSAILDIVMWLESLVHFKVSSIIQSNRHHENGSCLIMLQ